jgi:hypothetical protein
MKGASQFSTLLDSLLQPAIGSRRTSATSSPEGPHEIPKA